ARAICSPSMVASVWLRIAVVIWRSSKSKPLRKASPLPAARSTLTLEPVGKAITPPLRMPCKAASSLATASVCAAVASAALLPTGGGRGGGGGPFGPAGILPARGLAIPTTIGLANWVRYFRYSGQSCCFCHHGL